MKKILTLLAIVIALGAVTVTHAQIQKGNVMVGGDIAGFQLGLNSSGAFDMQINPKAAWFINDGIAIGAQVVLGLSTAKGAGTVINYTVGPLARYYINDPKVNLLQHGRWFFEGNAGIGGTNYSQGGSTNGLNIGVGPGYSYFVTQNIGLETLLKYNGVIGFGSSATSSILGLNVGFQIYLPGRATRNSLMNQAK